MNYSIRWNLNKNSGFSVYLLVVKPFYLVSKVYPHSLFSFVTIQNSMAFSQSANLNRHSLAMLHGP